MPNENEHPRYTDPDHPYSGSGLRYQNNYNRNEYHAGDGPFQFPWWAIVIGFVVWWPLGFIFIALNAAMKNGKLGSFEQKARTRTQNYRSGPSVQEGQFRPIYAQQDKESAGKTAAAPRDAEKKRKGMALANGLTAAGVLLLLCVTVNAANYISADRQLTQMLRMICDNQGTVPHFPPDGGKHGQKPDGPFTPETPYSTRYFVLL